MNNPKVEGWLLDNLIYRATETTQLLLNGGYAIQHLAKSIHDDLTNSAADDDYKPINPDLRLSVLIAISLLGEKLSHEGEQLENDTRKIKTKLQEVSHD